MKYIKPLILESKQVGILYHYTFTSRLFKILSENILKSERGFLSINSKNYDYISCTRNKNLHLFNPNISSTQVRIELNGDLLSTKYKLIPRDDNYKRSVIYDGDDIIDNKLIDIRDDGDDYGDEMEEAIITKQVPNIIKYINSITFYIDDKNDEFKITAYFNDEFNVRISNKKQFIENFNKLFPTIKLQLVIDDNYLGLWTMN